MKAKNTLTEVPTVKAKTDNVVFSLPNGTKLRPEDKEFIRRMNAFTQQAGLLSDDPFYEVL